MIAACTGMLLAGMAATWPLRTMIRTSQPVAGRCAVVQVLALPQLAEEGRAIAVSRLALRAKQEVDGLPRVHPAARYRDIQQPFT